ncbi:carboxylesterase [Aureobasidium subglaciale]|nr:carboxylesterase [Aureobasidium subglaciale]
MYGQKTHVFDAGPLGTLEGLVITSDDVPALHYFGGLPYALPPTGPHRFRLPRKLPTDYVYGTKAIPGQFTTGTKICPQPPSRIPPDASLFDEDCLQLNIWIPAGKMPQGGWPILLYLHGGFLQWGTANWKPSSLVPLLAETAFRAIVVLPAYRLNALGFVTGKAFAAEPSDGGRAKYGNMGFWDQRMALEWTHQNIANFGGKPDNMTCAGYSAGAYSTFNQLAHELCHVAAEKSVIKRVIMLSNGPGLRPKSLSEQQNQFDELVDKLGISAHLDDATKLAKLRELPFERLIDVQKTMKIPEFNPLADDQFHPQDLFTQINDGDFARRMKERGITLLSGECRDEHTIYRNWRTPGNSFDCMYARFCAEYPRVDVDKLLHHYCGSQQKLPAHCADWQELFGRVYADLQVHHMQRGFFNALFDGGLIPGRDVLRYRFDRRLECVDTTIPVEWGVTHSSDVPIWLWGSDFPGGLTDQERVWLRSWNEEFAAFVSGAQVNWGTTKPKELRRWRSDGETDVWVDDRWEAGLEVWNVVHSTA